MLCIISSWILLIISSKITIIVQGLPLDSQSETVQAEAEPIQIIKPIIIGDIRFHPDTFQTNISFQRSGMIGGRNIRWAQGILNYELDSGFSSAERLVIQKAMNEISHKTCIQFKERTFEPDWVFLRRDTTGNGCWSWLSKIGGKQTLNLQTPGCIYQNTIAHEIIHAIGFAHEQSRPDRDSFVNINLQNILPGYENNFIKHGSNVVTTFGIPYDLKSVMHYGPYYFSKDRFHLPTITSKIPGKPVAPGNELSEFDSQKINAMYRGICTGGVTVAPTRTPTFRARNRRPFRGK